MLFSLIWIGLQSKWFTDWQSGIFGELECVRDFDSIVFSQDWYNICRDIETLSTPYFANVIGNFYQHLWWDQTWWNWTSDYKEVVTVVFDMRKNNLLSRRGNN